MQTRPVSFIAGTITTCSPSWAFAWLTFGFFSVFGWIFSGQADIISWIYHGQFATTDAELIERTATRMEDNGSTVYAYRFRYDVDDQTYEATSFAKSSWQNYTTDIAEYVPDHPHIARLQGQRMAQLSGWMIWILLLPLAGIIWISWT